MDLYSEVYLKQPMPLGKYTDDTFYFRSQLILHCLCKTYSLIKVWSNIEESFFSQPPSFWSKYSTDAMWESHSHKWML